MFSDGILEFYSAIVPPSELPPDVEVLWPYTSSEVQRVMKVFYKKYFDDNGSRIFLIGINPGRFGAGLTGIGFTDPVHLAGDCNISHSIESAREISSDFIYQAINTLGGPEDFFSRYYITAMSPVGFIRHSRNLNYYDIRGFGDQLKPWMAQCLKAQISAGGNTDVAFSIGMGANYKFLKEFNREYKIFSRVHPLPHPRWIMQYRHSQIDHFIEVYGENLKHS